MSDRNPYSLRNVVSEKLHIPKAKTELFKKTFTYSGPKLWNELPFSIRQASSHNAFKTPEALKSLYRSPGNKKKQLVLCKNYILRHLGITINIKNTKFVKDLPMIDAQFRFNQCNSFREEYISVFSPYGSVLIL